MHTNDLYERFGVIPEMVLVRTFQNKNIKIKSNNVIIDKYSKVVGIGYDNQLWFIRDEDIGI